MSFLENVDTILKGSGSKQAPVSYVEGCWLHRATGSMVGLDALHGVHLDAHANTDVRKLWDTLYQEESVLGVIAQRHVLLR